MEVRGLPIEVRGWLMEVRSWPTEVRDWGGRAGLGHVDKSEGLGAGLARANDKNEGLGPGQPKPQIPHFYRQGHGQPSPQPLTSIGQTSLLLLARPHTCISQTPHFHWPDPSLLLAKPGRANPENCEPREPPVQLLCVKWQTLIAHCHIEIVKLPFWFLAEWPRPCAKVAEGRPTNIDRRCSTVSSKATERTRSRVYVITCRCLTTK